MYRVRSTKAAERDLASLPANVRPRLLEAMSGLAAQPRPPHKCRKLEGYEDAWRLTVGDCRILYIVDDRAQEIRVFKIGRRKDVYRNR
ncbi:MAG TPA: type II toxin-antitoxin system RelE/ParE family toxin [Anaerolineae bacterium]|nr:type II toxin-antitoxin system RelE/ParE family toxin [Anaerolineae bacterium]HOQ97825.1 type II toxin-antitoxin system RelE/ParE family toxin [Anaerolineae bacterium]HPL28949.1 type II toxin-antitoxin system RelE/ParE family toxin [Anaerolineae bacterium]